MPTEHVNLVSLFAALDPYNFEKLSMMTAGWEDQVDNEMIALLFKLLKEAASYSPNPVNYGNDLPEDNTASPNVAQLDNLNINNSEKSNNQSETPETESKQANKRPAANNGSGTPAPKKRQTRDSVEVEDGRAENRLTVEMGHQSASSKIANSIGTWTEEEKEAFIQGVEQHGKNWKEIKKLIPTRSLTQIRGYAQKYFQKHPGLRPSDERKKPSIIKKEPTKKKPGRTIGYNSILSTNRTGAKQKSCRTNTSGTYNQLWTTEEQEAFKTGLETHGKNWKLIQTLIETRTLVQIRSHAQKYFKRLEKQKKLEQKQQQNIMN